MEVLEDYGYGWDLKLEINPSSTSGYITERSVSFSFNYNNGLTSQGITFIRKCEGIMHFSIFEDALAPTFATL